MGVRARVPGKRGLWFAPGALDGLHAIEAAIENSSSGGERAVRAGQDLLSDRRQSAVFTAVHMSLLLGAQDWIVLGGPNRRRLATTELVGRAAHASKEREGAALIVPLRRAYQLSAMGKANRSP